MAEKTQSKLFDKDELKMYYEMQELTKQREESEIIEWNMDSCSDYLFSQEFPEQYYDYDNLFDDFFPEITAYPSIEKIVELMTDI